MLPDAYGSVRLGACVRVLLLWCYTQHVFYHLDLCWQSFVFSLQVSRQGLRSELACAWAHAEHIGL